MRIAFAMINCNRRDGSARPVNEVAERLAGRGHEVHLFAREAEDLDLSSVRWHRVPGPGWPEVADFWSYHQIANRMIRSEDFDVVHSIGCNTLRANVVTIQNIQPAKETATRVFAGLEKISLPRRFTRWLYARVTTSAERRLYTWRDGRAMPVFLPVSRGVEAELRSHYDIGDAVVRIIPNAADTALFRPMEADVRGQWRRANGFSEGDFVAVFCGGEWARKGLEDAIRAMAAWQRPDSKLFVAGDDPDRARYLALAASLGLGERIVFGGFCKDIATVLGSADVFLFPSHYEAFSLATIEAAACGLPIFATKINGTEDFVRPGVTGEFIDRDPVRTARLLEEIAGNSERLREMSRCARELVVRDYTWESVTHRTEEAYREVAHGLTVKTGGHLT